MLIRQSTLKYNQIMFSARASFRYSMKFSRVIEDTRTCQHIVLTTLYHSGLTLKNILTYL